MSVAGLHNARLGEMANVAHVCSKLSQYLNGQSRSAVTFPEILRRRDFDVTHGTGSVVIIDD